VKSSFKAAPFLAAASVAAALALSPAASATPIVFTGGSPGSAQGATATFDFSDPNTLTLTLQNTSDIHDIASILDDFHFDLSGTPTDVSITGGSTAGRETCVTSNGPPPHVTTCTPDPNTSVSGTWTIFLAADTPPGMSRGDINMFSSSNQQGQPQIHPFGIVNPTFITNAAQDGLSNAQHNPVLLGPVTFDIAFQGLTEIPTVTNVNFTFGTVPLIIPGDCVRGCEPQLQTPEPGMLALLAAGMLSAAAGLRRRRRH
jgi:type II secretory pathway pseudopilin PulG